MTKEPAQEAVKPVGESIDRRRFLELSRKFAIVAPPAVSLLISATEAEAHCLPGNPAIHGTAGCSTNH